VLSQINQPEMGTNPGTPCPSYGLNETSYLVAGGTSHYWRKTVEIRSGDGEVLGIIKRGCPAWTNSFAWKVPEGHGQGCRIDIDPSLVDDHECQEPEMEVLYTDQWSGLLNDPVIRTKDCHDAPIFNIYEKKRDVILSGYMIHSDFVIADNNDVVLGFCKLEGFEESLHGVGEHNFTFVDVDGNTVARAERPIHWENGATERVWNVTILVPGAPGTLGDARVVLSAVVHNVLLNEETDWCSDLVFTLTPVIITLCAIGLIAGISAMWTFASSGGASNMMPLKRFRPSPESAPQQGAPPTSPLLRKSLADPPLATDLSPSKLGSRV